MDLLIELDKLFPKPQKNIHQDNATDQYLRLFLFQSRISFKVSSYSFLDRLS